MTEVRSYHVLCPAAFAGLFSNRRYRFSVGAGDRGTPEFLFRVVGYFGHVGSTAFLDERERKPLAKDVGG